ncbi:MAG: methyltransferase domain-containing protein [Pseudonocardiaceae bacterium]
MIHGHRELAAHLSDYLTDQWKAAFDATPRHVFVPDQAFVSVAGNKVYIDREADPEAWIDAAYQDAAIVTQFDDGMGHGPGLRTSSCSMPQVVLSMLVALNVERGQRVLEIGTGTGYNAALLAHRLGASNVTSIEIDPGIAEQARTNLRKLSRSVTVVTGDGVDGYPPGAPYDRIIATAAVRAGRLPYPWVQQTAPGGMILTPWGTSFRNGELVRLVVQSDGTAVGTIVDAVAFMHLRSQRNPRGAAQFGELIERSTFAVESLTTVCPTEVTTDADCEFTVGLFLTDVQCSLARDDARADTYELLLYDVATESAATVHVTPAHTAGGRFPVRQLGPRRLWDELETAYAWWVTHDRPARTHYGITITCNTQTVWLGHPSNTLRLH